MELKPGYKRAEVGVIPEEWAVSEIGALCAGVLDCHHSTPTWTTEGSVVIRNQNIRDGKLNLSEPSFTDEKHYAERTRRAVPSFGDLVITREAPMGLVCMIPEGLKCCLGQRMVLLRPKNGAVETRYLLYALLSEAVQRSISIAGGTGSTVSNLRIPVLKELQISAPPIPEQHAIAEALSDLDTLLGALDRLIAKKRDLKQAAIQQLLTGQTRLPGFKGEWEVRLLKEIVQTPVTDGPHLTPRFFDTGIPFLSVNNLIENRIDLTELRFISPCDHEVFSRKCKPRKDDILLGKAASVGKVALVELDMEFNIWSPIALIRINGANVPRFVYYQLQSADLIGQITLLTNSSSQGNIGMGDIEKLALQLPPLPEQAAIAEALSDMDAEIAALEQRREKTRALKQGMMQELLTGRIRLR
jgi:type I restriction enzyme, S subunit